MHWEYVVNNPAIKTRNLTPFEQILPLTNSYEPVGMVKTHSIIHYMRWFMILAEIRLCIYAQINIKHSLSQIIIWTHDHPKFPSKNRGQHVNNGGFLVPPGSFTPPDNFTNFLPGHHEFAKDDWTPLLSALVATEIPAPAWDHIRFTGRVRKWAWASDWAFPF